MSIDGQLRLPLLNDYDRWRRAIFDFKESMNFQRMDDEFVFYNASIDVKNNTLALTKSGDKKWRANFKFNRAARDALSLEGDMDNHKVRMQLQRVDSDKFLLLDRGFHWIQEYPFNR